MAERSLRVVLVTAPDAGTADAIASGLVEGKLAACVNVVPGVTSHYIWEGKPRKEPELLLVIKTRAALIPELSAFVKSKHPAKVPEVVAVSIAEGDKAYLEWVAANTLFMRAEEPKLPY